MLPLPFSSKNASNTDIGNERVLSFDFFCYTLHFYLLPFALSIFLLHFAFLFATLCPIPPWLRTIFCLSVFVKLARISALTFATTRTACNIIRPTRKAWGASRNLGKGVKCCLHLDFPQKVSRTVYTLIPHCIYYRCRKVLRIVYTSIPHIAAIFPQRV